MNNKDVKDFKNNHRDKDLYKHEEKVSTIIVNGVRQQTNEKRLSFEEIVKLAFGNYDAADK